MQVTYKDGVATRGAVIGKVCEVKDLGLGKVNPDQQFDATNLEPLREARRMSIPVGRWTQVTPTDDMPVAAPSANDAVTAAAIEPEPIASAAAAVEPSPTRKRPRNK
jgi:hypothetical protein